MYVPKLNKGNKLPAVAINAIMERAVFEELGDGGERVEDNDDKNDDSDDDNDDDDDDDNDDKNEDK
jgi:hypothetical protein